MTIYQHIGRLTPTTATLPITPQRILIFLPCCIGDVVMATATLDVVRRAYPTAHLSWLLGGWSRAVVQRHPQLDAVLDTPAHIYHPRTLTAFYRLVGRIRAGVYDLVVSLSRSPRVSAAILAAGVPYRAGLDSEGRGFGYNIRAPIHPNDRRHEVEIYLEVARAIGLTHTNAQPWVPISADVSETVQALRASHQIDAPYLVVNPSGGNNPGSQMDEKRYPPEQLATILNTVAPAVGVRQVVIVAGPGDDALAGRVAAGLHNLASVAFVGSLTFAQVGGLARDAIAYIGNDTGLTHLAAAVGARTVMILGPTDPARYRPYSPEALALWKPYTTANRGATDGPPRDWDWPRDGISPLPAAQQIVTFLDS